MAQIKHPLAASSAFKMPVFNWMWNSTNWLNSLWMTSSFWTHKYSCAWIWHLKSALHFYLEWISSVPPHLDELFDSKWISTASLEGLCKLCYCVLQCFNGSELNAFSVGPADFWGSWGYHWVPHLRDQGTWVSIQSTWASHSVIRIQFTFSLDSHIHQG